MADIPAPITRIIPRPRPVVLGASSYLASEFRLADLADLQAWIEGETPDPLDELAPKLAGGPLDVARKQLLWAALDGVEVYPPRIGDDAGGDLLSSLPGLAYQLFLSLRRESPAFTLDDAARILDETSADQWAKFSRLAWGQTSRSFIRGMIERGAGVDPRSAGGPANWPALWSRYAATAGAGAPPFESLTLSQLRSWLAQGDPDEEPGYGEEADMAQLQWAEDYTRKVRAFWGDIATGAPAPVEAPTEAGDRPPLNFPWQAGPA